MFTPPALGSSVHNHTGHGHSSLADGAFVSDIQSSVSIFFFPMIPSRETTALCCIRVPLKLCVYHREEQIGICPLVQKEVLNPPLSIVPVTVVVHVCHDDLIPMKKRK